MHDARCDKETLTCPRLITAVASARAEADSMTDGGMTPATNACAQSSTAFTMAYRLQIDALGQAGTPHQGPLHVTN